MKRSSKYGNVKMVVDGRVFASKREAARYQELRLLLRAGEIDDLTCQPVFGCDVNGIHVCNYIGDFSYVLLSPAHSGLGVRVVEDVKGRDTPISRLKRKLVRAVYGIAVVIVK